MTLYAIEPGGQRDEGLEGRAAIAPLEHGGQRLHEAVTLWRLVDESRAAALRSVLDAAEADPDRHACFDNDQVWGLVGMLQEIEETLRERGVLDDQWLTELDRVPEFAVRVPGMDVQSGRTPDELRLALAEVVFRVSGVRTFLGRAAKLGCSVELS